MSLRRLIAGGQLHPAGDSGADLTAARRPIRTGQNTPIATARTKGETPGHEHFAATDLDDGDGAGGPVADQRDHHLVVPRRRAAPTPQPEGSSTSTPASAGRSPPADSCWPTRWRGRPGRYRYLGYPDPMICARSPASTRCASPAPDWSAEDPILNGSDERLFGKRLADFFTGRDPRGGNAETTIVPGCSRPRGRPCSRAATGLWGFGGGTGALDREDPGDGLPRRRTTPTCCPPTTPRQGQVWEQLRDDPHFAADQSGDLRGSRRSRSSPPPQRYRPASPRTALTAARRSCCPTAQRRWRIMAARPLQQQTQRPAARGVRAVLQYRVRPNSVSASATTPSAPPPTRSGATKPDPIPLQVAESTVGPMADRCRQSACRAWAKDVAVTPLQNAMVAAAIAPTAGW